MNLPKYLTLTAADYKTLSALADIELLSLSLSLPLLGIYERRW